MGQSSSSVDYTRLPEDKKREKPKWKEYTPQVVKDVKSEMKGYSKFK